MQQTQRQISTGLRVGTAADNASYWSIATGMRSDLAMISAVKDALAIGAARVDVASKGAESVIGVLNRFKMNLVTAMSPGADKGAIQQQLTRLSEEAAVIARSSSFNGTNWLNTDVGTHFEELDTLDTVAVGATLSGSINFDLSKVGLLNTGGGGALQKDLAPLGSIGGLRNLEPMTDAHRGHEDHAFTGPATFGSSDQIVFDLIIDRSEHSAGVTHRITIDKALIDAALGRSDGVIGSAGDFERVLQKAFLDGNVPATVSIPVPGRFDIGTREASGHAGSSIEISVISSDVGASALGLGDPYHGLNHDNMYPQVPFDFDGAFYVTRKAEFSFDLGLGSAAPSTVTVNRATVEAALGTSDGHVGSASDFAKVLAYAVRDRGIVVTTSGDQILFGADQTIYPQAGDRATDIYVGNVRDGRNGYALPFDLAEIDITKTGYGVADYLRGVEYMLERVTKGASVLGALRMRIDMEADFASIMSDNIAIGVGQFVDADMNEASTRFQALQVQQNLAIQGLSMANSNAEIIVRMFS